MELRTRRLNATSLTARHTLPISTYIMFMTSLTFNSVVKKLDVDFNTCTPRICSEPVALVVCRWNTSSWHSLVDSLRAGPCTVSSSRAVRSDLCIVVLHWARNTKQSLPPQHLKNEKVIQPAKSKGSSILMTPIVSEEIFQATTDMPSLLMPANTLVCMKYIRFCGPQFV